MSRLRPAAILVMVLTVAVLAGVGAVKIIAGVRHTNTVTDQRDRLIAALQADLAHVGQRLAVFDRELTVIAAERHTKPAQIRRLQRQIEALYRATGPQPHPTTTVTRTASPKPRQTVTGTPSCQGLKANGGCVPTHLPTILPSLFGH